MRNAVMLVLVAALAVACGGGATPTVPAVKQWNAPPAMAIDVNKRYVATIKTVKGDIVVELAAKDAPITVNNFVFLARQGFYDGSTFHRVIPGFVAQGGDPTGSGSGGPGYTIPDESRTTLQHDEGVIAMANTGRPNTSGCQFYITLAPQHGLDGGYNVFGRVTSGMDVVKKLKPRDPSAGQQPPGDKINTISIEEK